MIRLYAFVAGLHRLPERAEVDAVVVHGVTAVVGPDRTDDALEHGRVLQDLLECADAVLPARFGERFADTAALASAVESRSTELRAALNEVSGCVELAVRVARVSARGSDRRPDGVSYMRSRLRSVSADAAAADALHALLERQARATVVTDPALSRLVHDACYLVERDAVPEFASSIESYGTAHPELTLVCTGPWAPASFAEAQ